MSEDEKFGWDAGIYEHWGANRSGKTLLHALFGFFAYLMGMKVYSNCPRNPYTGQLDHIIRYPHEDYDPNHLLHINLYNAYIITDQAEQVMDARRSNQTTVRNIGFFGYQAKKRLCSWHYDTVRINNIDPRIRLNPDFLVGTTRYPKDWRQPLKAIKIAIWAENGDRTLYLAPSTWEPFFKLYNHDVMLTPPGLEPA